MVTDHKTHQIFWATNHAIFDMIFSLLINFWQHYMDRKERKSILKQITEVLWNFKANLLSGLLGAFIQDYKRLLVGTVEFPWRYLDLHWRRL